MAFSPTDNSLFYLKITQLLSLINISQLMMLTNEYSTLTEMRDETN